MKDFGVCPQFPVMRRVVCIGVMFLSLLSHADDACDLFEKRAIAVLTNGLNDMAGSGFVGTTNHLCAAVLEKFELPGVSLPLAYKVMAGMSAVELGLRETALDYAGQVPSAFRITIEEFANEKCP